MTNDKALEAALLQCPFCGSSEHLSVRAVGSMTADMPSRPYQVICTHIDHDTVCGPVAYGRAEAIAAWNRRAPLSALPGEAEVVATLSVIRNSGLPTSIIRDVEGIVGSLQAMQARAEAAEAALAQLDGGSDHADNILAESAKFSCHECIAEEREFSCHDLEDVMIVEGKVVCKECVAEFYPKARAKPASDIGKKLRRQRMFARQQQARAEAAEDRVKELEEALKPFARHLDEMKFDLDNKGNELPDELAVGWVYVTNGDFRRARTALTGGSNG